MRKSILVLAMICLAGCTGGHVSSAAIDSATTKCEEYGGLGSIGSVQVIGKVSDSYSAICKDKTTLYVSAETVIVDGESR